MGIITGSSVLCILNLRYAMIVGTVWWFLFALYKNFICYDISFLAAHFRISITTLPAGRREENLGAGFISPTHFKHRSPVSAFKSSSRKIDASPMGLEVYTVSETPVLILRRPATSYTAVTSFHHVSLVLYPPTRSGRSPKK